MPLRVCVPISNPWWVLNGGSWTQTWRTSRCRFWRHAACSGAALDDLPARLDVMRDGRTPVILSPRQCELPLRAIFQRTGGDAVSGKERSVPVRKDDDAAAVDQSLVGFFGAADLGADRGGTVAEIRE